MTLKFAQSLIATVLTLSVASYANPLHDFVSIGDKDGIAEYIRENRPSLEEFEEVDNNGETPLDIARRTNNAGLIEVLTQTETFLRTAAGFRGFGVMHPVHAYVERADAWGFILYLTYFEVTSGELMNDRHGRNVFEIALETGNTEMIQLVGQTLQHSSAAAFSPLREIQGGENTYASNPQAHAAEKGKEEEDAAAATENLSDEENSNSQLFGSDGNGLFFDFEEGDDASLRVSLSGFLSPR